MFNDFNSERNPGPAEGNPLEDPYPAAQLSMDGGVQSTVSALTINGVVPSAAGRRNSSNAASLQAPASAYEGLTDAEIMLLVKAGDDAAYEYLVLKFRRPILGFLYRMAHNSAVAEELTQEVFLRVYRSRHTYNADAKFTTWLYRIASNLAVNHARDTKHERAEASVSLNEPDPETGMTLDLADQRLTVEQELVRRERLQAIRQHVQALPERQRVAVIMHKYQGLDYRQIADTLKLSESATKSLLFRAYETLRQRLADFV
jgi:RNA polymerase sigma-70 factor (ECF subfamily)